MNLQNFEPLLSAFPLPLPPSSPIRDTCIPTHHLKTGKKWLTTNLYIRKHFQNRPIPFPPPAAQVE